MSKAKKPKETTDAIEILDRLYVRGDPEMQAMLEEERINAEIARKIYDLREKAGLTQRELAKRIGTTASVICRLEDADYEGHSLSMLRRIAEALNHRLEIRLVEKHPQRKAKPRYSALAVAEKPAAYAAKAPPRADRGQNRGENTRFPSRSRS